MGKKKQTVGVRFVADRGYGVNAQLISYNDGSSFETKLSGKVYHYFTPFTIKKGEFLVVQVGNEYKVVVAVECSTKHIQPYANKWITGRVSAGVCFDARKQITKLEDLETRMNEYYEQQTKYARWEKLVARDRVFRKMYKKWLKLK